MSSQPTRRNDKVTSPLPILSPLQPHYIEADMIPKKHQPITDPEAHYDIAELPTEDPVE